MKEVCRPGNGAETCRYLTVGGAGLSCEKLSMLGLTIDMRVDKMVAKGDNCAGMASLS